MKDAIVMDGVGRLVLPKTVRERLHVTGPARFRPDVVGNRVELTLLDTADGPKLTKKGGLLVIAGTGRKVSAVEAIRQTREDRDEDILRHIRAGRRHAGR